MGKPIGLKYIKKPEKRFKYKFFRIIQKATPPIGAKSAKKVGKKHFSAFFQEFPPSPPLPPVDRIFRANAPEKVDFRNLY